MDTEDNTAVEVSVEVEEKPVVKEEESISKEVATAEVEENPPPVDDVPTEVVDETPRKQKKKRSSSMLKSLESTASREDIEAILDHEADDGSSRYQSSRAAAIVAKTKLNASNTEGTKKGGTATTLPSASSVPDIEEDAVRPGTGAPSLQVPPKEPKESNASRRGGKAGGVRGRAAQQQLQQQDVKIEWVLCDKCEKWRSIAPHISVSSLPTVWQCSDNTWDNQHNYCEAEEETEESAKELYAPAPEFSAPKSRRDMSDQLVPGTPQPDDTPADRRRSAGGRAGRGGARQSLSARRAAAAAQQQQQQQGDDSDESAEDDRIETTTRSSRRSATQNNYANDDEDTHHTPAASGRGGASSAKRRQGSAAAARGLTRGHHSGNNLARNFAAVANQVNTAAVAAPSVNWVQCNDCSKWRKVPDTISMDSLPEKWFCRMNSWNPLVARCSAKEEEEEPATTTGTAVAVPTIYGLGAGGGGMSIGGTSGGGRAGGRRSYGGAGVSANAAAMASAAAATAIVPPGTVKKTSWVQCERKSCKKWRKVPAHIDVERLPDKWYCEMNTWNLDAATCDAPQDSDSDDERNRSAAVNRQLILGNNKGAAVLSYRRIIFGNDAKIRSCFSDKNKLGNGLFTYPIAPRKPWLDRDTDDQVTGSAMNLEPVRRVSYWWSTAHDDRIHGLHPHCAQPSPSAEITAGVDENSNEPAVEVKSTEPKSSAGTLHGSSSSYILDTAKRLYNNLNPPPNNNNKSIHEKTNGAVMSVEVAQSLCARMTLYQRMSTENTVVRSVVLATGEPFVLFTQVQSLLQTTRFVEPSVEACRICMQQASLIDCLHRLELAGEAEVAYTAQNQLVVGMLPTIDELKRDLASRRARYHQVCNGPIQSQTFDPRARKCFQQKYVAVTPGVPMQQGAVPQEHLQPLWNSAVVAAALGRDLEEPSSNGDNRRGGAQPGNGKRSQASAANNSVAASSNRRGGVTKPGTTSRQANNSKAGGRTGSSSAVASTPSNTRANNGTSSRRDNQQSAQVANSSGRQNTQSTNSMVRRGGARGASTASSTATAATSGRHSKARAADASTSSSSRRRVRGGDNEEEEDGEDDDSEGEEDEEDEEGEGEDDGSSEEEDGDEESARKGEASRKADNKAADHSQQGRKKVDVENEDDGSAIGPRDGDDDNNNNDDGEDSEGHSEEEEEEEDEEEEEAADEQTKNKNVETEEDEDNNGVDEADEEEGHEEDEEEQEGMDVEEEDIHDRRYRLNDTKDKDRGEEDDVEEGFEDGDDDDFVEQDVSGSAGLEDGDDDYREAPTMDAAEDDDIVINGVGEVADDDLDQTGNEGVAIDEVAAGNEETAGGESVLMDTEDMIGSN